MAVSNFRNLFLLVIYRRADFGIIVLNEKYDIVSFFNHLKLR